MEFELKFTLEDDGPGTTIVLDQIFNKIREQLNHGSDGEIVRDANGNRTGSWKLEVVFP